MRRRIFFFSLGVVISIAFLSMGPNNRLKETFYAYIDYFDMNKRVITHLHNDSTTFSIQSQCQMVYYGMSKDNVLSVLEDGTVNFDKSQKDTDPCQYYAVENEINTDDLSVEFEYCYKDNTVQVIRFILNNESEVCNH
mgnify:CR=1 FL=1